MGYTIIIHDKVTSEYVTVHGASGTEQRKNMGPPINYPATYVRRIWQDLSGLYGDDPTKRVELIEDSAGVCTSAEIWAACPGFKPWLIEIIKGIRKAALAKSTTDAVGVFAVYDENYAAAVAVLSGEGATVVMKNGYTAYGYMAGFARFFGKTAEEFAEYIIGENRKTTPAYLVEQEYLRLVYTVIPGLDDIDELLALPAAYRRSCGL